MQLAQARVPCDKKRMESPLEAGKFYIVSAPAACTVSQTSSKGDEVNVAQIPETGGQRRFLSIATLAVLDNDDAVVSGPFSNAPDLGAQAGGYIESNLNVGHGAADAVAAVCKLTLGDPTAEGDLRDNAEHALHLDAQPALQSHGVLTVADATEGGTLTIGETELPAFAEKKETPASISLALNDFYSTFGQIEFGVKYQGEDLYDFAWMNPPEEVTPADLETALNDADNWQENSVQMTEAPFEATWDSATEKMTLTALTKSGEDSNDLTYEAYAMTPFVDPADPSFSGGQDARTMDEAVNMVANAINTAAGEDVEAVADYENNAVNVTAAEAGAAGDLLAFAVTGDLLEVTEQMDGGQDARTYAEVIAAINGDNGEGESTYPMGVKAEATLVEVGQITLTSRTAGAAANAITYTATGCFGSGTVKQGSTTRGKNEVFKTDKKIFLNGDELFGESTVVVDVVEANNANAVTSNAVFNAIQAAAPHAPTPESLGEDTAMKNGHVYTLAAAGTALDFSDVTLGDNATAEVWVECTAATNITWPPAWKWLDNDGAAPEIKCDTATEASHRYRIVVLNEGSTLNIVARVAYDYPNPLPTA